MIRVQTWKAERLIEQKDLPDELEAERYIDAMLTKIHTGEFGQGTFRVEADHVDQYGLYLGAYFRTPPFPFPRERQAA